MKKLIYISVILLLCNKTYSQTNLVPNGSFEQYTNCPNNQGQVNFAIGWIGAGDTPDYFNACNSTVPDFSVPYNWGGYQIPLSGNAYTGIGALQNQPNAPNLREFIGVNLSSPLVIGTKYFVSFNVNLAVSEQILSNCATNNLGAIFTVENPSNMLTFDFPNIGLVAPKVNSAGIITDTSSWKQIFGSFVSDSSYQYVFLGNFLTDQNTDTLIYNDSSYCASYYFIDDVCVSTDSLFALNNQIISREEEVSFFPNPIHNELKIYNKSNSLEKIEVFDKLGRLILTKNVAPGTTEIIDFSLFANEIYTIRYEINNKLKTTKIIKL